MEYASIDDFMVMVKAPPFAKDDKGVIFFDWASLEVMRQFWKNYVSVGIAGDENRMRLLVLPG